MIAVALMFSVGMHWNLLQVVAWGGMIVKFAQQGSVTEAVEKTFDGEHPCSMCKAIEKGKAEEKKAPQQKNETKKPEMFCASSSVIAPVPHRLLPFATRNEVSVQFGRAPPVPPPRAA